VNGSCNGNDVELMGEHVSLEYIKNYILIFLLFSICNSISVYYRARGIFYLDTNAEAPWACGLCA